MKSPVMIAVLCAAAASALPSQRRVVQVTTSLGVHQDATISPDGRVIAFRGAGLIGVVGFSGGPESTIATGASIGSFLWSPNSSGVYFLDGNNLRFAAAAGGSPLTLATMTGTNHRLWAVNSTDQVLWGTRLEAGIYRVFIIPTNGGAMTDIATDTLLLDDVALDPSEQFVVFGASLPQPFQPKEYFRNSAFTKTGRTSFTGSPISGANGAGPSGARWVDNGNTIAFEMVSPTALQTHLYRLILGQSEQAITDGPYFRRSMHSSRDGRWLVHAARWGVVGTLVGLAIIPGDGGAQVMLSAEDSVAYILQGLPSMDDSGSRVAFAASANGGTPQIYTVVLDGELRVRPRVEVGKTFSVDMPISASEVGVVFLGGGLYRNFFAVPPFQYGLVIDPLVLIQVVAGASSTGALSVQIPVPNRPSLIGQAAAFQGFRALNASSGEFTRAAEFYVF